MPENSTPSPNRRIELRLTPKRAIKVACRKGTSDLLKDLAIRALDIAETGARLVVREHLNARQEVTLTIESPRIQRPMRIVGNVIWCLEMKENDYCVGVQFKQRLTYPELERLT